MLASNKAFTMPMALGTWLTGGSIMVSCGLFFSLCSVQADRTADFAECRQEIKKTMGMYSSMREGRAIAVNLAYNMAGIAHRETAMNPEIKGMIINIPNMIKQLGEIQESMGTAGLPIADMESIHE